MEGALQNLKIKTKFRKKLPLCGIEQEKEKWSSIGHTSVSSVVGKYSTVSTWNDYTTASGLH